MILFPSMAVASRFSQVDPDEMRGSATSLRLEQAREKSVRV